MVAQRQQERVEKYIALGQEEGARVVVGGNGHARRASIMAGTSGPPILVNVDNRMRVAHEEIFGPVQSVLRSFEDEDEAVSVANDSDYGLAAGDASGPPTSTRASTSRRRVRTGTYRR